MSKSLREALDALAGKHTTTAGFGLIDFDSTDQKTPRDAGGARATFTPNPNQHWGDKEHSVQIQGGPQSLFDKPAAPIVKED